jgi:hypothetical protein
MDLLGTWGKRTQDLLGRARTTLLGDDLPPDEKRAATVGTFGPSVLEQTGQMLEAQQRALGPRNNVRDLLHDPDAYQAAKQVAGNLDFTGTFGGVFAKGADLGAHNLARRMKGEGKDPGEIWEQTGWFQGPDKKWRFEIDDSAARINYPSDKWGFNRGGEYPQNVGDFLGHDPLYAAYPEAKDIQFSQKAPHATMSGERGSYAPAEGKVPPRLTLATSDAPQARSTALHELQHHIQEREGFARGGMPTHAPGQSIEDYYNNYRRLAGEAEARLVQSRRSLTAEERRMLYPWLGYDVPPEQQIVRGVRD